MPKPLLAALVLVALVLASAGAGAQDRSETATYESTNCTSITGAELGDTCADTDDDSWWVFEAGSTWTEYSTSIADRSCGTGIIADPDPAAVNYVWENPTGTSATLTEFRCEAFGGTSVTVNLCDGEDYLDDTCSTSILGSTLVCGTSGASDSTLSATALGANDKVSLVLTAESGTVDRLFFTLNCSTP